MRTNHESGSINALLLPLLLAILLLVGAASFGAWAYSSRQDYKNNVDAKINTAVGEAKAAEDKVKDAQFAESEKNPLKTYTGPAAYGSLVVQYPKTWSGYVSDTTNSDPFVNGYFNPGVVPNTESQTTNVALHVQVVGDSYSNVMQVFQSQLANDGGIAIKPYSLPKVPAVVGSMVDGNLGNDKTGHMVVLPMRDKTLKIWTDADTYQADFNNIILANFSFSP